MTALAQASPPTERTPPERTQLLAAAGLFLLGIVPLVFFKFRNGFIPGDLTVYRHAGSLALHRRNFYAVGFGAHLRVHLPFTYPPFAALAVIPLAVIPARLALIGWSALNLALVAGMTWWLVRPALVRAGRVHPAWTAAAAAALAWTVPAAQTLAYGQVNIVLAFFCLADCVLVRPGSPGKGVLVGVATAIKLTPGLFILYYAATRQWAAAARAAVTALALELAAAVLLPAASRSYWLHLWWNPRRTGDPKFYFNQSIYGTVLRLGLPTWLWPVLGLVAIALALWRARQAHGRGADVAAVALVGFAAVLVSPISWQHHAVWIIPMFGVLAAWAARGATPRRWVLVGVLAVLFIAPVPQIGDLLLKTSFPSVLARVIQQSDVVIFWLMLAWLPLAGVAPVAPVVPVVPVVSVGQEPAARLPTAAGRPEGRARRMPAN
ncbi:MAG TPA: glycosyltransferase 87 family protein [Actinomycetota bacterium]|nr:glycosyltransferase 87 family protein [Actinomycetota bacterium]